MNNNVYGQAQSHSARSAWIETFWKRGLAMSSAGRTPQGVRGLKLQRRPRRNGGRQSHSARSAWIETVAADPAIFSVKVALRKECVD